MLGDEEIINVYSLKNNLEPFNKLIDLGGKLFLKEFAEVCNKMAIDRFKKNGLIRAHVWVVGTK